MHRRRHTSSPRTKENGNRAGVSCAELAGPHGGPHVTGAPTYHLPARCWTSEGELDTARDTDKLRLVDAVHLTVDLVQRGLGPATCGPASCRTTG